MKPRHSRPGSPLAQHGVAAVEFALVAIIRLRHVKTLNQQYGYEFGSQLLQHFSKVAKAALPSNAN